jgi:hypothetical protein
MVTTADGKHPTCPIRVALGSISMIYRYGLDRRIGYGGYRLPQGRPRQPAHRLLSLALGDLCSYRSKLDRQANLPGPERMIATTIVVPSERLFPPAPWRGQRPEDRDGRRMDWCAALLLRCTPIVGFDRPFDRRRLLSARPDAGIDGTRHAFPTA